MREGLHFPRLVLAHQFTPTIPVVNQTLILTWECLGGHENLLATPSSTSSPCKIFLLTWSFVKFSCWHDLLSFDWIQAWDGRGISVEECLLTCEGAKLCDLCKPENPWKYHGARYIIPFSLEFPHFEVMTGLFNLKSSHFLPRTGKKRCCYLLTYIVKPVRTKPNITWKLLRVMDEEVQKTGIKPTKWLTKAFFYYSTKGGGEEASNTVYIQREHCATTVNIRQSEVESISWQ